LGTVRSKKKFIQASKLKTGSFTAQAKAHDMGVQEFANAVMSGEVKVTAKTKKRASLAKTLSKLSKRKKKK
jgi:hypothetical protein